MIISVSFVFTGVKFHLTQLCYLYTCSLREHVAPFVLCMHVVFMHVVFLCVCSEVFLWTHHERVLHSDDGTVQDGGGHRGDLEQLALPALALPLRQRVSSQVGHQLLDLLAFAFGEEGLGLVQSRFGHHDAGRTVLRLGEDLDRLALERLKNRSVRQTEREVT